MCPRRTRQRAGGQPEGVLERTMLTKFRNRRARARATGRSFWRDQDGVSAIEFAIILPFMMAAFLGVHTIADAQRVAIEVSRTGATVGDMIARSPSANDQVLDDTFKVADAMVGTQLKDELQLYAAGIAIEQHPSTAGRNRTRVLWVRNNGNLKGAFCAARPRVNQELTGFDVPDDLMSQTGQFFVYVRARLEQTPMFGPEVLQMTQGRTTINHEYANMFLTRNDPSTNCVGCTSGGGCS